MKLKFKIGLGEIEILIRAGWTQRLTGGGNSQKSGRVHCGRPPCADFGLNAI